MSLSKLVIESRSPEPIRQAQGKLSRRAKNVYPEPAEGPLAELIRKDILTNLCFSEII